MTDPRIRLAPVKNDLQKRDQARAVEEGLAVLTEAVVELLRKPKEERGKHLDALAAQLALLGAATEELKRSGVSLKRLDAIERVIAILSKVP